MESAIAQLNFFPGDQSIHLGDSSSMQFLFKSQDILLGMFSKGRMNHAWWFEGVIAQVMISLSAEVSREYLQVLPGNPEQGEVCDGWDP